MAKRTLIRAQVPVERVDEALGYFQQLVPDAEVLGTDRIRSGVVAMGAYLDGDRVEELDSKIEALDTNGIHFMVDLVP